MTRLVKETRTGKVYMITREAQTRGYLLGKVWNVQAKRFNNSEVRIAVSGIKQIAIVAQ